MSENKSTWTKLIVGNIVLATASVLANKGVDYLVTKIKQKLKEKK